MKSQEQRRRRITEKYSSKEIEELSKFSEPDMCLIFIYNSFEKMGVDDCIKNVLPIRYTFITIIVTLDGTLIYGFKS